MKTLALFLVFTFVSFAVSAQKGFEAGIKAGIQSSKLSVNIDDYNPQTINKFLAGAFFRINMGHFYLQPEAYYNSKGGEYIDELNLNTVNSFDLKTVDVPALVGLKIIKLDNFNLRVFGGPVFTFVTDKSVKGQLTESAIKENFFGWQYGAGMDFLYLTFDVRMESYSNNLYETPNFDSNTGFFVISLGLKLF